MMQLPQSETESNPTEPRQAIPYASEGTQFATLADVTAVVIRVCAVITFFQFVSYLGYLVDLLNSPTRFRTLTVVAATPVAQIVLGLILWIFAQPLSRFFAPPRAISTINSRQFLTGLSRIAFATVGVVLFVGLIPELVNFLSVYLRLGIIGEDQYDTRPRQAVISLGLKLAVILWLIVGNERIGAIWRRLRAPNF